MNSTGNGNPTTPTPPQDFATPLGAETTGTPGATHGRPTDHVKQHLGEAGTHFRQAARDTGDALRGAATAAGDELRQGRARVRADLADGTTASRVAADHAGDAAREQLDELMEKGRELMDSAAVLIRERPLASFGTAFAAGWLISRIARSGK